MALKELFIRIIHCQLSSALVISYVDGNYAHRPLLTHVVIVKGE